MKEKLTFQECDTCIKKPGSPDLCAGCLNNRKVINELHSLVFDQVKENERLGDYIKENREALGIPCTCSAPFSYAKETCLIHGTRKESPYHPQ